MRNILPKNCIPRWYVLLPLCLLLFAQCTTPRLSIQEGKQIEQLGVCLVFGPEVPQEFQEPFETRLESYMTEFNGQPHPFKLIECQDESSMLIKIENVKYTTSSQRAAGLAVSAVGLVGVPVAMVSAGIPFYAFFYYFPKNETFTTLALSDDIAHPTMGAMNRIYTSGGMFGSDTRQRQRHVKNFDKHLTAIFTELERSYEKTARKPAVKSQQKVLPTASSN